MFFDAEKAGDEMSLETIPWNAIGENADKLTKEAARRRVGGDEVEAPEIKDEQDSVGPEHREEVGALHPAEGGASQLRHPHMQ